MGTLSIQPPSGATRTLTEIFNLLRNNAVQSRHIFQHSSVHTNKVEERMSLVPLHEDNSGDAELGLRAAGSSRIPPEWVNIVDEIQFEMTRITNRLKELKDMQQRHMTRPSFNDDSSQEDEAKIEAVTEDITRLIGHCQRLISAIKHYQQSAHRHNGESLVNNVVAALTFSLQNVTLEFRQNQTRYLNQIETREDNFQQYFGDFTIANESTSKWQQSGNIFFDDTHRSYPADADYSGELSMEQIQHLAENTGMVKEREKEIVNITKSIMELNTLFKDLAGFVIDQGTVLDRIDYNVEHSAVRVKSGLKQVVKAEQYQRKNRKMQCIMILSICIIALLLLLIIVKF